jgi:hypothetical protein
MGILKRGDEWNHAFWVFLEVSKSSDHLPNVLEPLNGGADIATAINMVCT